MVADGRILENYSLKVNESSLTGESEGVDKSAEILSGDTVALGDQKNMVFSGSLVTYGRATVVITATGHAVGARQNRLPDEPDPAAQNPSAAEPGQFQ